MYKSLPSAFKVNALTEVSKVLGEATLRGWESSVRSFKRFFYSLENSWKDLSTDTIARKRSFDRIFCFVEIKSIFPIKNFEIGNLFLVSIFSFPFLKSGIYFSIIWQILNLFLHVEWQWYLVIF